MRKNLLLLLATFVVVLIATPAMASTQIVYGYIWDAKTTKGIYRSVMYLMRGSVCVSTATAARDGYYECSTTSTGSFTAVFSKAGYNSVTKSVYLTSRQKVWMNCYLTAVSQDTTPPTQPVVTDAGAYTNSTTQLAATWSSQDAESGIAEYQYSLGKTAGGVDVLAWTSAGSNTSVTVSGLNLTAGQTYYFNIKAKNGVGLWSSIGSSDGIKVNSVPQISGMTAGTGKSYEEKDPVHIAIQAADPDSDPLQYQVSVNGTVKDPWNSANTFDWQTASGDLGTKAIKAEVKDTKGASTQASSNIFGYRKPVQVN